MEPVLQLQALIAQEVNDGKATTEQYFVLKNLCARIDELIAAKGAAPV